MVEKLKSKLSPNVYRDLEHFVNNDTNFSAPQKEKFIKLLENIHAEGKTKPSVSLFPKGGTRDWD